MKYEIGDVLCLNNHPYTNSESNILLQADASMIPPLMVVIEVLNDYTIWPDKPQHDENTGVIKRNQTQVKCVFYSHKTHKFESNWFNNYQLRKISSDKKSILKTDLKEIVGKNTILKTWDTELGKKKVSLKQNSNSNNVENGIITAHLSFLPPVMTVIDVKKAQEIKEPNFDKKTGGEKRKSSEFLLKCKWYNPYSDSYSEDFFPLETLELLEAPNYDAISTIEKYINEGSIYIIFEKDKNKVLAKPLQLYFNHCYYELEYYDYIINSKKKIEIRYLSLGAKPVDNYFTDVFPQRIEIDKDYSNVDIAKELELQKNKILENPKGKYYRIKYRNSKGDTSIRTINNFIKINDVYFTAYCNRRGTERNFKFEGLIKIEVLNV